MNTIDGTPPYEGASAPGVDDATREFPQSPGDNEVPVAAESAPAANTEQPQWISGPAPITTLAGLLALVVAVLAVVRLVTDVELDWSLVAPVTAIVFGVICVAVGVFAFSRRARTAEHRPTA